MGASSRVTRGGPPFIEPGAGVAVVPSGVSAGDLARALLQSGAVLVEAGLAGAGGDSEVGTPQQGVASADSDPVAEALAVAEGWPLAGLDYRTLFLSLTTRTAYGCHLAAVLADSVVALGIVLPDQRSGVELCLQEAIANAIIHGNLGISSAAKDAADGHTSFSHQVSERLEAPATGLRRLFAHLAWNKDWLVVRILDQGNGFDPDSVSAPKPGARARSGRGMMFMRALSSGVEVGHGGRSITLKFQRQPEGPP